MRVLGEGEENGESNSAEAAALKGKKGDTYSRLPLCRQEEIIIFYFLFYRSNEGKD